MCAPNISDEVIASFLSVSTLCCVCPGSMYWEPAESGSQQTVGRSGGLPACFCQYADEIITGILSTTKQWCCYILVWGGK